MSNVGKAAAALKVYVGNLPWTVSKRELQNYLSKYGNLKDCKVIFNRETGMSRGYGFAIFRNKDGVEATMAQRNHYLDGAKLQVSSNRFGGIPKEALNQEAENVVV